MVPLVGSVLSAARNLPIKEQQIIQSQVNEAAKEIAPHQIPMPNPTPDQAQLRAAAWKQFLATMKAIEDRILAQMEKSNPTQSKKVNQAQRSPLQSSPAPVVQLRSISPSATNATTSNISVGPNPPPSSLQPVIYEATPYILPNGVQVFLSRTWRYFSSDGYGNSILRKLVEYEGRPIYKNCGSSWISAVGSKITITTYDQYGNEQSPKHIKETKVLGGGRCPTSPADKTPPYQLVSFQKDYNLDDPLYDASRIPAHSWAYGHCKVNATSSEGYTSEQKTSWAGSGRINYKDNSIKWSGNAQHRERASYNNYSYDYAMEKLVCEGDTCTPYECGGGNPNDCSGTLYPLDTYGSTSQYRHPSGSPENSYRWHTFGIAEFQSWGDSWIPATYHIPWPSGCSTLAQLNSPPPDAECSRSCNSTVPAAQDPTALGYCSETHVRKCTETCSYPWGGGVDTWTRDYLQVVGTDCTESAASCPGKPELSQWDPLCN